MIVRGGGINPVRLTRVTLAYGATAVPREWKGEVVPARYRRYGPRPDRADYW